MRVRIDGALVSGRYRVDCQCGSSWSGQCPPATLNMKSPAMPIAECITHFREAHRGYSPELQFSARFEEWLYRYWEVMSQPITAQTL